MSSARALRWAQNTHTRLNSSNCTRPTLTSRKDGHQVTSSYMRFNSSVPEAATQDAPPENGPANPIRDVLRPKERAIINDKVIKRIKHAAELRSLNEEQRDHRQMTRMMRSPWKIPTRRDPHRRSDEIKMGDNGLTVGGMEVPNIWLRDNCQCEACVHEETKQRLLDTFSIPEDISVNTSADFEKHIEITWSDGHTSQYDKAFINDAALDFNERATIRQGLTPVVPWGADIAEKPPQVNYNMLAKSVALDEFHACLEKIRLYGFCYINHVPKTPKATRTLLEKISFIRETHYGGFYDFTADLASKDTAYTNIALPAHTDTTYFSDPAGLQAFHLLSHTGGHGGASLLVDGFKAAQDLMEQDPDAYNTLATVNVHAHASGNDNISIQPYKGFPVLEHDTETAALLRVRWNVSDRAGIELPLDQVEKWYAAARKWDAILKSKENEYWEQLTPGKVLIFDNWRVLHGRSAFTGKRRICGGYINRDDWISKWKMLHFGKEKVLGSLASG